MTHRISILLLLVLLITGCSNEQAPPQLPNSVSALKVPISTSSPKAREAYLNGRKMLESLRFSESVMWFERALEEDPDFSLAHLKRARLAENAERYFRHLELAEAGMESVSAGEQLMIKAFRAASQGRREDQAQYLKKLVALYSGDERAHMALGTYYAATRQYPAAQKHLETAIAIAPDFAPAFNMLGYAFRGTGDFDGARLTFQRYVELMPDQANPYDSLAELMMEAGDYVDSIAMYRRALDIDPYFGNSYYGITVNYSLLGDYENALKAAAEMSANARNVVERHRARLAARVAHLYAGNLDGALDVSEEMAEAALESDSFERLAIARELAGDVLVFRGDTETALRKYQAAYDIRRESELPDIGKQRARFQFLFKTTLAALQSRRPLTSAQYLEQYEQEVRESGNDFDRKRIFALNGIADIISGKDVEAIDNLSKADPFDPVVQYFLAVAHERAGHTELAKEHAKIAAYRNTLDPRLAYFRKPALELLQRLDSAVAAINFP